MFKNIYLRGQDIDRVKEIYNGFINQKKESFIETNF